MARKMYVTVEGGGDNWRVVIVNDPNLYRVPRQPWNDREDALFAAQSLAAALGCEFQEGGAQ